VGLGSLEQVDVGSLKHISLVSLEQVGFSSLRHVGVLARCFDDKVIINLIK